jgi:hypothetical protein
MTTGRKFWIAVGIEATGFIMAVIMMIKVPDFGGMKEVFSLWGTFAVTTLGVFGVTNVGEHLSKRPKQ